MSAGHWLPSAKAVCLLNCRAISPAPPPLVYSYIPGVIIGLRLEVRRVPDLAHAPSSPQLYVELVVKNPLCPLGQTVQSELFRSRLDSYVRSLPFFSARAG